MTALHELGALDLWRLLHARDVSALEVSQHFLERIDRLDEANAFVHVDAELALAKARAADDAEDRTGLIHGLPFADKHLGQRAGQPADWSSEAFRGVVADSTDEVATVLDAAGGVTLGRTNAPEIL